MDLLVLAAVAAVAATVGFVGARLGRTAAAERRFAEAAAAAERAAEATEAEAAAFRRDHVENARVEVARARDLAAAANHFMIDTPGPERGGFGDIACPALVVHGELDPVFPLPHGQALRDAIPGARLVVLDGAGHELPPARWDRFVAAVLVHTAGAGRR